MPIPATVTPIDPVENVLPTMLVRIFDIPSAEKPSVTLPLNEPDVIVTRRLFLTTPLLKHLVDVSDCHDVASQDVSPIDMLGDLDASPKLDPCTVSIIAESDAAFNPKDTLTDTASVDKISVIVPPSCNPAVTISLRLPLKPGPVIQCIQVSDFHAVIWLTVWPSDSLPVKSNMPCPLPTTVMLKGRPKAWLMLLGMPSDGESAENIALALPDTNPAVSVVRKLADMLRLLMHTDDVSDAHIVASHVVAPITLTEVHDKTPKPSPATANTTEFLGATLTVEMLLNLPASYDRAADMLPSETPPVTPTM
jgi:hypothetical protein